MPHRVAVVILNWNTRHLLEKFLPSVLQFSSDAEIIVADNGSTDDSIKFIETKFPAVRIIRNEKNEGYTGGYNSALKQVDAEFFVLLNSDVMVTENWIAKLLKFMDEHPEAGACQPKILSYNEPEKFEYAGAAGGYIDKYGYPFCRGRIFNSLEVDQHQYDDVKKIFWASGACMMVRSSLFRELNGFDPNFFAHMEEIDLCWRLQQTGKYIYYCPDSKVYHVGGGSLHKSNPRKTYLNFRNNLLLIYKNADSRKVQKILNMRFYLDLLASLLFLLRGSFSDFNAVWKARSDFKKMKGTYNSRDISKVEKNIADSLIYQNSILWDYYFCTRKKYSDLDSQD